MAPPPLSSTLLLLSITPFPVLIHMKIIAQRLEKREKTRESGKIQSIIIMEQ